MRSESEVCGCEKVIEFTSNKRVFVDSDELKDLNLSSLRKVFGDVDLRERIPLYGGAVRFRESWNVAGVLSLRDTENEIRSLSLYTPQFKFMHPDCADLHSEKEAVRSLLDLRKGVGLSYTLEFGKWHVYFDYFKQRNAVGRSNRVATLKSVSFMIREFAV